MKKKWKILIKQKLRRKIVIALAAVSDHFVYDLLHHFGAFREPHFMKSVHVRCHDMQSKQASTLNVAGCARSRGLINDRTTFHSYDYYFMSIFSLPLKRNSTKVRLHSEK